mmetsp:Transcript_8035/g.12730  ORF Transcript_8035/g.12730 Transcript_8035/m.12730 type:complete len:677 (-) Transcript_8035:217-2247(-)
MMQAVQPPIVHRPEAAVPPSPSEQEDSVVNQEHDARGGIAATPSAAADAANPLSFLASITVGELDVSASNNNRNKDENEAASASEGQKDDADVTNGEAAATAAGGILSSGNSKTKKMKKPKKNRPAKEEEKKRKRNTGGDEREPRRNVSARFEAAPKVNPGTTAGAALAAAKIPASKAGVPSHVYLVGQSPTTTACAADASNNVVAAKNFPTDYEEILMMKANAASRMGGLADGRLDYAAALAGQHQQQQQEEQRRLLINEMLMLEERARARMPENFLSRQYAALEQEELELAALRRRREQLFTNMNNATREDLLGKTREELLFLNRNPSLMMKSIGKYDLEANPAAAAAFLSRFDRMPSAFGQRFAGLSPATPGNVTAAGCNTMGGFPSSLLAGMGNNASPSLHGLSQSSRLALRNQANASGLSPALSATPAGMASVTGPLASLPNGLSATTGTGSSTPSALMKAGSPSTGAAAGLPAKRLAPARGVFNKNIKSNDDVIDSLARANARFYKNADNKKNGQRFRNYQCEQWTQKYHELLQFKEEHGNCQVPHCYKANVGLARWVKRQRYQYKLMTDGKQSTMTSERVKLLEDIGFIWDSHAATWEERLNELREYRSIHGDCNVPSSYTENPKLATWIKCQRRQYKLLQEGKTSNMTLERMTELQRVGFCWRVQDFR